MKRVVEFDENSVTVTESEIFSGALGITYPLSQISHQYQYREFKYFGGGCLVFAVLVMVSLFLMVKADIILIMFGILLMIVPYFLSQTINDRKVFEIKTKGETIRINAELPSPQEAKLFVNSLIEASRNHMKWKYGTIDPDLDFELQINNFRWLRNNQIISEPEYEAMKTELKNIKKIGDN